jgi:hypothetical protein
MRTEQTSVVRIVQNRAPSEISYAVPSDEVNEFMERWRAENPGAYIFAQSMPLWMPDQYGDAAQLPVEYPDPFGGSGDTTGGDE